MLCFSVCFWSFLILNDLHLLLFFFKVIMESCFFSLNFMSLYVTVCFQDYATIVTIGDEYLNYIGDGAYN